MDSAAASSAPLPAPTDNIEKARTAPPATMNFFLLPFLERAGPSKWLYFGDFLNNLCI
jgi:hypothetical protein